MNLIEAIKSGKPIRRRGRSIWRTFDSSFGMTEAIDHITDATKDEWMNPDWYLDTIGADKEDLLADDWEIQEPVVPDGIRPEDTVTITRRQFWAAVDNELIDDLAVIHRIAKNLGLDWPWNWDGSRWDNE